MKNVTKSIIIGLLVTAALGLSGCGKDNIEKKWESEFPGTQITNRTDNKDKTVGLIHIKAKDSNAEKLRSALNDDGKRIYYVLNNQIFFSDNKDLIYEYETWTANKEEVTVDKIVDARDFFNRKHENFGYQMDMNKNDIDFAMRMCSHSFWFDQFYPKLEQAIDARNKIINARNAYYTDMKAKAPGTFKKLCAKNKNNSIPKWRTLEAYNENGKYGYRAVGEKTDI